jgi:hypothetical protein
VGSPAAPGIAGGRGAADEEPLLAPRFAAVPIGHPSAANGATEGAADADGQAAPTALVLKPTGPLSF